MNCCDRLLVLFVVFSFFQYQKSWKHDEIVTRRPWSVWLNGSTRVPLYSSSTFSLTEIRSTGMNRINVSTTRLSVHDHENAFLDASIVLTGPPMSYHTVSIGDRVLSLHVPPDGNVSASVFYPLPDRITSMSFTHRFDHSDSNDMADAQLHVRIFSM